MKALHDGGFLHGDCITVTGKTIAENLADVTFPTNQDIVLTTDEPLSPTGGVVGLRGNLAPEGALVKVAGMKVYNSRVRHGALIVRKMPLQRLNGAITRKEMCW